MFQWGLGGRASYHVQVKSEIKIFSEGGGSHLSMSRPNLKFKTFGEVGDQSSFHVQAKSEI